MRLPAEELARRITEFQVAENAEGRLLGALGLHISERQGLIHSEAFGDFALADHVRPLLWDRLQSIANHQGLLRLWTQEQAPFWSRCGLGRADTDAMARLPAAWRESPGVWLTLKLREDVESLASVDREFALFMQAERQRTQRSLQHGKVLKMIATLIALGFLTLVIAGAVYILRQNPNLLQH